MGTPEERAEELAAFELAVSPYYERVRRYCMSQAQSVQLAEDVAQEVIVKAFRSWKSFEDIGAGPWPWLKTIAKNALSTAGVKESNIESRREFVNVGENGEVDFGYDEYDLTHGVDSPEMQVIEKFGMAEIESAINSLDEEFREVAYFRFIVGMDNIDIAEMLQLNQKTVATKIFRAREKLSVILKEMAAGYGIGLDENKKKYRDI